MEDSFNPQEPECEGICASSVLFLPGIQASRLYSQTVDVGGTEQRHWEPFGNADIRALAMDADGESINDVYTKDIIDEIFGVVTVYQGLIDFMDELEATDVIEAWEAFPYDWRQSVFDVVENGTPTRVNEIIEAVYPADVLEALASESHSGKVTIVAHSNGGLLAKALVSKLEAEGKAGLVDRIVMIGTPQLGTPKGIGAMLHGMDQQAGYTGILMDDVVVREVIKNMPGAYGLLPGQAYFDSRNDIVIGFDVSDTTADFRAAYGNAVTADGLTDFLLGTEGRGDAATIHHASLLNNNILQTANTERQELDQWQAPAGVEIVEIVGVGLNTVSGFVYQEFGRWNCSFGGCTRGSIYKPVPYITQYGDKTVVGSSAEGYFDSKSSYYIDLESEKKIKTCKFDRFVSHVRFTTQYHYRIR